MVHEVNSHRLIDFKFCQNRLHSKAQRTTDSPLLHFRHRPQNSTFEYSFLFSLTSTTYIYTETDDTLGMCASQSMSLTGGVVATTFVESVSFRTSQKRSYSVLEHKNHARVSVSRRLAVPVRHVYTLTAGSMHALAYLLLSRYLAVPIACGLAEIS
jgi:hypothetical protein